MGKIADREIIYVGCFEKISCGPCGIFLFISLSVDFAVPQCHDGTSALLARDSLVNYPGRIYKEHDSVRWNGKR